jgi:hypothetical protein
MDKTCPMHEVRETIRYLNEGHARDKVVITVLLPNHKHRGTQISCPTLREQRRPVSIGEVLAVVFN